MNLSYWSLLLMFLSGCCALSTMSSPLIKIVGIPGGQTQSLPASYVETFDRWVVQSDGKTLKKADRDAIMSGIGLTLTLMPELRIRPCLDVVIKNGVPSYVMGGVQARLKVEDSGNNNEENSLLLAMPLAKQWTTMQFAAEPTFRLECFSHPVSITVEQKSSTSDQSTVVTRLDLPVSGSADGRATAAAQQMQGALERFGIISSELDVASPLLTGFHIISVPLPFSQWAKLPEPKSMTSDTYSVLCLATAEPDTAKILHTFDQNLLEMTASSLTEFKVRARSGSEMKREL